MDYSIPPPIHHRQLLEGGHKFTALLSTGGIHLQVEIGGQIATVRRIISRIGETKHAMEEQGQAELLINQPWEVVQSTVSDCPVDVTGLPASQGCPRRPGGKGPGKGTYPDISKLLERTPLEKKTGWRGEGGAPRMGVFGFSFSPAGSTVAVVSTPS